MSRDIFLREFREAWDQKSFHRLTLSKPLGEEGRKSISLRPVEIGGKQLIQVLHRSPTRDTTENVTPQNAVELLTVSLGDNFGDAHLETNQAVLTLRFSRKGVPHLSRKKTVKTGDVVLQHDRKKHALLDPAKLPWLADLGLADAQGKIFPSAFSKWNQVQRFVELLDHAARDLQWTKSTELRVSDMGSGKGYLTFAIESWLTDLREQSASVTGLEQRPELVDLCNSIAAKHGRKNLAFSQGQIADFSEPPDLLIALHACNTATDDALAFGIKSGSQLIVCAPCCQHELREKMAGSDAVAGLLAHGLFRQRQAALITDALRTLVLEREGYTVRVVDFVSSEHTDKNLLLIATKSKKKSNAVQNKIDSLKSLFGIPDFHLETLLT